MTGRSCSPRNESCGYGPKRGNKEVFLRIVWPMLKMCSLFVEILTHFKSPMVFASFSIPIYSSGCIKRHVYRSSTICFLVEHSKQPLLKWTFLKLTFPLKKIVAGLVDGKIETGNRRVSAVFPIKYWGFL